MTTSRGARRPPTFTARQRTELVRIGVPDAAIVQIEAAALPWAREWMREKPRKADVTDELKRAVTLIKGAHAAIERLLGATEHTPIPLAARSLIAGAGGRHSLGGRVLDQASKALQAARDEVQPALEAATNEAMTRHRTAHPYPVRRIHDALQLGLVIAGNDEEVQKLRPSASPTSSFAKVVAICYAAIGAETVDLERPLKAYVREWKQEVARATMKVRWTEHP